MLKINVSKLVPSVVLLESASILSLQAQGGVTDNYVKPFDSKSPFKGLGSTESTEVLKKSGFSSPLVRLFCGMALGTFLVGVFFYILGNVERRREIEGLEHNIGIEKKEIAKLESEIKELDKKSSVHDADIKITNEKILKLEKEYEETTSKKVNFKQKYNTIIDNFCKMIETIKHLINYHNYLRAKKLLPMSKKIADVCKKLQAVDFEASFDDILYSGEAILENFKHEKCSNLCTCIKHILATNHIDKVFTENGDLISNLDVDKMQISDVSLRQVLEKEVSEYKRLFEIQEQLKKAVDCAESIQQAKLAFTGRLEDFFFKEVDELPDNEISEEGYRSRVDKFFKETQEISKSLEEDAKLKEATDELQTKLSDILSRTCNKKDSVADEENSLRDLYNVTSTNGEKITKIEQQIECFKNTVYQWEKKESDLLKEKRLTKKLLDDHERKATKLKKTIQPERNEKQESLDRKKSFLKSYEKDMEELKNRAWYSFIF